MDMKNYRRNSVNPSKAREVGTGCLVLAGSFIVWFVVLAWALHGKGWL